LTQNIKIFKITYLQVSRILNKLDNHIYREIYMLKTDNYIYMSIEILIYSYTY